MKKQILAVLLTICLVFLLSVPAAATGDPVVRNVTTQSELMAALALDQKVDEIHITQDLLINTIALIHLDDTKNHYHTILTVEQGVVVTIASGGELGTDWYDYQTIWSEVTSQIVNNGTLVIQAGGKISECDQNNGIITVQSGGVFSSVGSNEKGAVVEVQAGATMICGPGSRYTNRGTIHVAAGNLENNQGAGILLTWGGCVFHNEPDGILNNEGNTVIGIAYWDSNDDQIDDEHVLFDNNGTINSNGFVFFGDIPTDETAALVKDWFNADEVRIGMPVYTAAELSNKLQLGSPFASAYVVMGNIMLDKNCTGFSSSLYIDHTFGKLSVSGEGVVLSPGESEKIRFVNNGLLSVQNGAVVSGITGNTDNIHVCDTNSRIVFAGINSGSVSLEKGGTGSIVAGKTWQNGGIIRTDESSRLLCTDGGTLQNLANGQIIWSGTLQCDAQSHFANEQGGKLEGGTLSYESEAVQVIIDLNGGSTNEAAVSVLPAAGAAVVLPEPAMKGYAFIEWKLVHGSQETAVTAGQYTLADVNANYRFAAVWEMITMWGDMNGDQKINTTDALINLRIAVKKVIATPIQKTAGDVNGDGNNNTTDALLILRKAVDPTMVFPVEPD